MRLSIVIAVYNTGEYLHDCLDSVIEQELSQDEYEVICVNDVSTDDSFAILKEYEARYKCVKIINQENRGHTAIILPKS